MKRLLVLLALAAPGAVLAEGSDLSYSYAELRFVDADNGGDGLLFGGSFAINENWIVLGSYSSIDFSSSVDQNVFEIGGGYVLPYRSGFDLVATAQYVRAEIETPVADFDDSGFLLSGGTRGKIAENFEVRGSVNYVNIDDSDVYIEIAGDYHFTEQLSAGLSFEVGGDNDVLTFGARWYFQ